MKFLSPKYLLFSLSLIAANCFVNVRAGLATALFNLDSPQEFQQALDANLLRSVSEWDSGMEFFAPGEESFFRTPTLFVNEQGLVIEFGEEHEAIPVISAFDYVYDEDPDLTNHKFQKTVNVPVVPGAEGAWVGVMLTDENGKKKVWSFGTTAGGTVTIDIAANGGQQGADKFKVEDGFDISKVTVIRQPLQIHLPPPPVPPRPPGIFQASETRFAVEKVPESTSTITLLALGTLGAGSAVLRKQKQKSTEK